MTDTILFYWSFQALSRAIRFRAEAEEQLLSAQNGHVLATIAGYYSLFHLGTFLCCAAPQHLDGKTRKTLAAALVENEDVSRALTHRQVDEYLKQCQLQAGLPVTVHREFAQARKLRNFVNYGPDLLPAGQEFRIHNRELPPDRRGA